MNMEEAKQRALSLKSRFDREFVVLLNEDEGTLIIRQSDDTSPLPCGADCATIWRTDYE
jgi:hypothetical protein